VFSDGGLWVGLITRPEKFYRLYVPECDLENLTMRWPWNTLAVVGGEEGGRRSKRRMQKIA